MIEWLLEPWQYPFMLRALGGTLLVGIVCAVVGSYVVVRGMAFFGDALAHAILPGVAVGYLLGRGESSALFWGALAAALLSALGIGTISRSTRIKEDTAIGIIFAGMFALGIALISSVRNYSVDLAHFLFGDVLGIREGDLWRLGGLGVLIVLTVLALYKEFLVLSFDPVLAATLRIPARLLDYVLMILIALTVVLSLQTVGVALTVAMLITPAATAYLLTRRLHQMMLLAAALASLAGLIGLYFSFYLGIASGAAIVLTATFLFGLVWLVRYAYPGYQR